jgi:hypothetical protein
LTYNESATGSQAGTFLENESNRNVSLIVACGGSLILLSYILFIRKIKIRTVHKILIGVPVFFILSFLMEVAIILLQDFGIPVLTTSVIGKITGIILYGSVFLLSKDRWVRLSLLIILACGFGNLLSHFYIPFRVIDFISVEGLYESAG